MENIILSHACTFLLGFAVCKSYIQLFPKGQDVWFKFCECFSFLWATSKASANVKMLKTVHVELLDRYV